MTNHLASLSCGAVCHVVQRRSVNSWVRVSPFFKKEVFYWCQCFCWWYFNRLLQMMNRTINFVILNAAIQSPDSKRKFFLFKLSIRHKFVAEEFKNLATLWKETTKHLKEIRSAISDLLTWLCHQSQYRSVLGLFWAINIQISGIIHVMTCYWPLWVIYFGLKNPEENESNSLNPSSFCFQGKEYVRALLKENYQCPFIR